MDKVDVYEVPVDRMPKGLRRDYPHVAVVHDGEIYVSPVYSPISDGATKLFAIHDDTAISVDGRNFVPIRWLMSLTDDVDWLELLCRTEFVIRRAINRCNEKN